MFDDRPADPLPGSLAVEGSPGFAKQLPGAALVSVLEQADLDALDDDALVEVVAGWRRLQSWAAARSARAAAALSERASMNPYWPSVAGDVREPCVAGEELALRLGCSRRAARDLVRSGKAYDAALWPTGDALERGEIDEGKARLLVKALTAVPGEVAVAVQEDVLPRASRRTHSELAADIQRSLIRVDPDDAAERVSRATSERRVCRPTVLPDGMAGIWAVLPAPAAVALDAELDAVARRVRGVRDGRTLDQLRADALCLAVLARGSGAECAAGSGASGCGIHVTGGRSVRAQPEGQTPDPLAEALAGPPLSAQVSVTVPLDVLCGLADGAGELAGYGPISSATAEALARGGTWRRLVTDPLSGTLLDVGRTRYRPPPGLDAHVRTRDGTCVRPGCPTSAWSCDLDHTVPYVGHDPRPDHDSGPDHDPRPDADADASGGTEAAAVAEHDRRGGPTAAGNLGALCRRDHLLKTHAGFRLRQVVPGVFEWTTPTGHRYEELAQAFPVVPSGPPSRPIGGRHNAAHQSARRSPAERAPSGPVAEPPF